MCECVVHMCTCVGVGVNVLCICVCVCVYILGTYAWLLPSLALTLRFLSSYMYNSTML